MVSKLPKVSKLDAYEREIENNLAKGKRVKNFKELKEQMTLAAKRYGKNKKSITIRVSTYDLEAIKIKASKQGIPYQTYLNALIHQEATKI
jgi:predicted DNA binding CopG/RHH family protein